MIKHFFILFELLIFGFLSQAQGNQLKQRLNYPLSISPRLNANFGEMRPNHFHMGLDLFTERRENLTVYAPSDGFVSRVKIELGGFGRAIYIDHPNGTTSVYAHMNRFLPSVESYLEKKQYEQETWKIDLKIPAGMIKVKRGDLIGYSGNTGASEGPHVHFELRDTKTENCLNPLTNGINISDHVPPILKQLAFYDFEKSIYDQIPILVSVIKKGESYVPLNKIELPFDKIVVGIVAVDMMNGNPNGIYSAFLKKEQQKIAGFVLENISYDFTRNQNGHIDYVHRFKGGAYIQLLHRPKFFQSDIYPQHLNKPFLQNEDVFYSYSIEAKDANGNKSHVDFQVKRNPLKNVKAIGTQNIFFGKKNFFEQGNIRFEFPSDAFYDSFRMTVVETMNSFQVQPSYIPVNSSFQVFIKPNGIKIDTGRAIIKRVLKSKVEVKKATFDKNRFIASFKEFGNFQLIEDIEPPVANFNILNANQLKNGDQITLAATDNFKAIRFAEVRCDGNWLMFKPSGSNYIYRVDEHLTAGEHLLTAIVIDEAGNQATAQIKIKKL